MALQITYKSPPFAGKSLDFDDTIVTIRIGRSLECEVPFPEEITIIGHEHFALVRSVGVYKFAINTRHRVFADGKDVFDGQELHGSTQVRLGAQDGPSLLLEPQATTQANVIATVVQGESSEIGKVSLSTQRWTGIVTISVVLIALAGSWAYYEFVQKQDTLFEQLAKKGDFSTVVAKYQKSVFLVDYVDSGGNSLDLATAWVVALSDGRRAFATNAHVAKLLQDGQNNDHTLLVRSPDSSHVEFKISKAIIHPGFDKFKDLMDKTRERASKTQLIRFSDLPLAYDVAVLIPETQEGIPEPLPVANKASLDSLHSGQPVLLLGYPAEGIINFDVKSPSPTAQVGVITSIRSFFLSSESGLTQLIEHSLPATGGASGSPILDERGEVIGLLNGGNLFAADDGTRVPNAALINFGQRADLLKEVIDGTADSKLSAYLSSWQSALARWNRDPQSVIQQYIEAFQAKVGALDSMTINGKTGAADPSFGMRSTGIKELELKAGGSYLLIAQTHDGQTIHVFFVDTKKAVLMETKEFLNGGSLAIVYTESASTRGVKIAFVSEEAELSQDGQGKRVMTPSMFPVSYDAKLYWAAKSK